MFRACLGALILIAARISQKKHIRWNSAGIMDSTEEGLETVVQTLASQPSEEELTEALRRFQPASSSPSSPVASVIFAIVNTTLPELWRSLQAKTNSNEVVLLIVECLSSVAGVNALLMRLDQLHNQRQQLSNNSATILLEDVLEVLTRILEGKKFSPKKVIELCALDDTKNKLLFNEYAALVGGSKILNVVSKAAADLDNVANLWIADGKRYSKWFGERLGIAIIKYSERPEVAGLIVKALSLGYPCNLPQRIIVNSRFIHRGPFSSSHRFPGLIGQIYSTATSHTASDIHQTFVTIFFCKIFQLCDISERGTLVGCRPITGWSCRWCIV